jgi:hypothetical protein
VPGQQHCSQLVLLRHAAQPVVGAQVKHVWWGVEGWRRDVTPTAWNNGGSDLTGTPTSRQGRHQARDRCLLERRDHRASCAGRAAPAGSPATERSRAASCDACVAALHAQPVCHPGSCPPPSAPCTGWKMKQRVAVTSTASRGDASMNCGRARGGGGGHQTGRGKRGMGAGRIEQGAAKNTPHARGRRQGQAGCHVMYRGGGAGSL